MEEQSKENIGSYEQKLCEGGVGGADKNSKNKSFASKILDLVTAYLETELETILVTLWQIVYMSMCHNIPDAFCPYPALVGG